MPATSKRLLLMESKPNCKATTVQILFQQVSEIAVSVVQLVVVCQAGQCTTTPLLTNLTTTTATPE